MVQACNTCMSCLAHLLYKAYFIVRELVLLQAVMQVCV